MANTQYKSPLHEMAETTPSQFWNDSCSIPEMEFALEHGAVGATTNPVIVGQVLENELETYIPVIKRLIDENPEATEDEIAWKLNEYMAVQGAKLLEPVFKRTNGSAGYISIQTNAKYYRNAKLIVDQAAHFATLAPNIMVKMPATKAGIAAIEECTYLGINVNATVSFTVAQAVAVAEAIKSGMGRREKEGKDNSGLHPVCTLMVGRLDDLLKDDAKAQNIDIDLSKLDLAGIAVMKNAYRIYKEKGYHARLLSAAYRNQAQWTEFIGGDVSMTITHGWIKQFANSDVTVENRMDTPIDAALISELKEKFPNFVKGYEPDAMRPEDFDFYGATRNTLAQFLSGYDKMVAVIRGFMV